MERGALKKASVFVGFGVDFHSKGRTLLSSGCAGGLLWQKHGVDVWQHTALSDGDSAEELVQLLVVAHSELDVARNDAGLLVVARSVASQLEDLSSEVLEYGGEVHWGTGANARSVAAALEEIGRAHV